jgi:heparanase
LAASDYALIDEDTLEPRPNYWSALLWRRLMGRTVLEAGTTAGPVHVFAHCLRDHPGGVAVLAVNTDREAPHALNVAAKSERYTLSAKDLLSATVALNGTELKLGAGDALPSLTGQPVGAGDVQLEPASITFLAIPNARNASCRAAGAR